MKLVLTFVILASFVFPVYSQDALMQRYRALSEIMDRFIIMSNDRLAEYDRMIMDDGNLRTYSLSRMRFELLVEGLRESEVRLNMLFRGNARSELIRAERDNFYSLLTDLERLRADYDEWLRTVR